ncbi:hypothetical protein [Streptomyces sp. NRRL S-337]|uniref:hypothetical protein n=1 Tax=Streptomyces sp. NRRL S-337 TaxID=1463900 RepID=UPI0004CC76E9|nr:hypothetical protein [Streptomyces sp. NRRL S-337]
MKYAKSAAVVAGSVLALGAAAPAFAAPPGAPTMSLNGAVNDTLSSDQLDGHQLAPLLNMVRTARDKVKAAGAKKLLGGVNSTAKNARLLGGLPLK